MASPEQLTFDITPPRRPGINDVGGGQKENDGVIPDYRTMPCAEDDNQHQNLLVAYGKVVDNAKVTVHFAAGTPSVAQASGCGSAIVPVLFTVTDNGAGDTSITWPAGSFPAQIADHTAKLTGATIGAIVCETIANGARIRTTNTAWAATDLPFVLEIN